MPYAFYIRVSELWIMVSFDIQYILELQIRILVLHEWRYMWTTVLCIRVTLTAVQYLHDDQTDGGMHNDQTDADLQM